MPIVFIVSGIFVLGIIFDFDIIKSLINKKSMGLFFLILMFGYLFSNITIGSIGINFLFLINFTWLVILSYDNSFGLFEFLIILITILVYKIFLDCNIGYLISYNSTFCLGLIVCISLVFIKTFKKGLFYCLCSSFVCLVISSIADIKNYAYSVFNFDFIFLVILCYSCLYIVFNCLKFFMFNFAFGRSYVKENFKNKYTFVSCFINQF